MIAVGPEPLAPHHKIDRFESGEPSLDAWLGRRARANQISGASRTFVLCDDDRVIGYYALASGSADAVEAPGRFRRNMPQPIPVIILARLAIDREFHGRGLGRALLRDAGMRAMQAAETIGIRGIVVHAISDKARAFYTALGFEAARSDPLFLFMTLSDVRTAFGR